MVQPEEQYALLCPTLVMALLWMVRVFIRACMPSWRIVPRVALPGPCGAACGWRPGAGRLPLAPCVWHNPCSRLSPDAYQLLPRVLQLHRVLLHPRPTQRPHRPPWVCRLRVYCRSRRLALWLPFARPVTRLWPPSDPHVVTRPLKLQRCCALCDDLHSPHLVLSTPSACCRYTLEVRVGALPGAAPGPALSFSWTHTPCGVGLYPMPGPDGASRCSLCPKGADCTRSPAVALPGCVVFVWHGALAGVSVHVCFAFARCSQKFVQRPAIALVTCPCLVPRTALLPSSYSRYWAATGGAGAVFLECIPASACPQVLCPLW
jgi:hypothetical protein